MAIVQLESETAVHTLKCMHAKKQKGNYKQWISKNTHMCTRRIAQIIWSYVYACIKGKTRAHTQIDQNGLNL